VQNTKLDLLLLKCVTSVLLITGDSKEAQGFYEDNNLRIQKANDTG